MNIPMVDLKAEYALLKKDILKGVTRALESAQYIQGPNVRALEEEVATYCGVRHAISVASGTDALHLALRAAGIGPGDEVITTSFTFIATASSISFTGATPVFVDIDPATYNIDPAAVAAAITPHTRAILPVHLYGQPADLAALRTLCDKHDLLLVEDAAQAFGAEYGGRKCGTYGDMGCFSFYPSKNLGAFGDGGMVVTDNDEFAAKVRLYRDHGSRERYHYAVIGYNSRLDELQAVILRVKLGRLDEFNQLRRAHAAYYNHRLKNTGIELPAEDGKGLHIYHQYTIASEGRNDLHHSLTAAGIGCAIYYPLPLHQQEVYRGLCSGLVLPRTEHAASRVLSLPMSPLLTEAQMNAVCAAIKTALL